MALPPQGGSWAVYKDGDLADSGAGLAGGARVRGGGLIVVGQVTNESTASAHVTSILISDWLTGAGRGRGQVLRRRVVPRPPDPPGRVGPRAGGRGGGEAAAAVRAVQRRPRALASGLQRPPGPHQGGRRDTGHLNIVIIQISPLNFCNECPSLAVPENAEIEVQGECRNVTWYVSARGHCHQDAAPRQWACSPAAPATTWRASRPCSATSSGSGARASPTADVGSVQCEVSLH